MKVDMGERRKTLKIWLKRTRDRGVVEGTRLEAKDTKKSEAKDSPFEDRPFLGQGHRRKCSPKKNSNITVFKNFFYAFKKKGLLKFFQVISKNKIKKSPKKQIFLQKTIYKILRIPKILLSSSRGRQYSRT